MSSAEVGDEAAMIPLNSSSRSQCQGQIHWASAAAFSCDRSAEMQRMDEDWQVANLDPTKTQVFHHCFSITIAKIHKIITLTCSDAQIFTCLEHIKRAEKSNWLRLNYAPVNLTHKEVSSAKV